MAARIPLTPGQHQREHGLALPLLSTSAECVPCKVDVQQRPLSALGPTSRQGNATHFAAHDPPLPPIETSVEHEDLAAPLRVLGLHVVKELLGTGRTSDLGVHAMEHRCLARGQEVAGEVGQGIRDPCTLR